MVTDLTVESFMLDSQSLKEAHEYHGVSWKFIHKRAPWCGGFWERLVGLTKQALKEVLGRSFCHYAGPPNDCD